MAEITDPTALSQLNASGDDFLGQLSQTHGPGYAALVKATAEGASAAPSGMAMRTPYGQQLTQDVYQYDPTADAVNLPNRISARKAFTSGKQGQALLAAATALEHSKNLDDAVTNLGNVNPGFGLTHIVNGVRNAIGDASGDTNVTQFQNTVTPLVDELERAYTQTGGNVTAIKDLRAGINLSQSLPQQRKAIQTFATLLAGKIDESNKAYNLAMGTVGKTAPGVSPEAMQLMQQYQSPDYVAKGLAGLAAGPGDAGGSPPANGGNPPIIPGGSTPPTSGGPAAPTGPVALSPDGSSNFETPDDKAFYDAETQLIQNPKSTRADFDALSAKFGRPAYGRDLDKALDARNSSGAIVNNIGFTRTASGHTDPSLLGEVASSAPGAAVIEGANAASFDTLPKVAAGLSAVGDKLTSADPRSLGDVYDANLAGNNAKMEALDAAHPLAALGGQVGGFVAGDRLLGSGIKAVGDAVPGLAALGSRIPQALRPAAQDATYGAATGAGGTDNIADLPGNVLTGGGTAALGGALGRGAVRGVAALASPIADASVQRLTKAGVTLTPGQILGAGGGLVGRAVKGVEDRVAGFPVIGDIINNARRGGVEDFNRASINDALAPIGESANGVGHAGVADAQQKVSDAYTSALSKMTATPDAAFTTDLQQVAQKSNGLSQSHRDQFANILDTDLQPYLNGKTQLSGSDLQDVKQGLDTRIANLQGQGSSPQDRDLADRLGDVRTAVMSLAARTDPAAAADFAKADQAYAMLSRVNNAASKAKDGVFTPNQFRQAVTKRGYGTTTNKLATGSALMQQLSTDASTVLPSTVPDSGTAGRAALGLVGGHLLGGAPGAALGAAGGYEQGGAQGALVGGALGAAAFSRPGLRGIQNVLAGSRGKTFNTLGDILRANASLGGALGTPLALDDRSK